MWQVQGWGDNKTDIVPDLREHPSCGMMAALPHLFLVWKTLTTQGSALGPTLHLRETIPDLPPHPQVEQPLLPLHLPCAQ